MRDYNYGQADYPTKASYLTYLGPHIHVNRTLDCPCDLIIVIVYCLFVCHKLYKAKKKI